MKTTKTLLALFLILSLICTLSVSAFAVTPTQSAMLNGENGSTPHSFVAYQIFSGTQADTDTPIGLADVAWGSGVNADALLALLDGDSNFAITYTGADTNAKAKDVADFLKEKADDSAIAIQFAKYAYEAKTGSGTACVNGDTSLEAGYYLVVDETVFAQGETNTYYNMALLQMTKKDTFEIRVKAEYPTVEKKVQDKNDSTGDTSGWQDSADYDIGDEVPFQITVTLPDMTWYDTYEITISDTLSAGLTAPNKRNVKIFNGTTDITNYFVIDVNGQLITANSDEIKDCANNGDTLTMTFSAVLNENAVIGSAGNDNVVDLEYSNNPNDLSKTGKTPEDLVRVFTYRVVVNKVDDSNPAKPLTGADFKLEKKVGNDWVDVTALNGTGNVNPTKVKSGIDNTADCVFTFTGLDDGEYKLTETATPNGYNSIDPIEFTVEAGHVVTSDDPQLTSLTGTSNDATFINPNAASGDIGTLETTIENKSGVVLPETGDEGTQMLYAFGSILLLGALVLIVTKKRVGEQF